MTTQLEAETDGFVPTPDTSRRLRNAFGAFATGVTVVTTRTSDGPIGMTANSFSSVSLDPPLVLWCIGKHSDRYQAFVDAERYAIHILSDSQLELSNGFAQSSRFFEQVPWHEGADGVPALSGCLARFDCEKHSAVNAGDHIVLIGRILEVRAREGAPLLFSRGGYGQFAKLD